MKKNRREGWRDFAKCKKYPIDLFFFETDSGRYSSSKVERARKFCSDCIVQKDCLSYALNENIEHGMWGGFSSRERNSIKRSHESTDYSEIATGLINKTINIVKKQTNKGAKI